MGVEGCGLMLLQQLVGINTVMYYSATILAGVGFGQTTSDHVCCCPDDAIPIWLASVVASSQLVGTIIGLFLGVLVNFLSVFFVGFFV